ncbi:MAG: tetratricopeptide repeat protein, partial [candidate division Zixibacteria bacterium]|nr:tetratricopeptide repeat protein [candidate division Zixibacteria bacterium]
LSRDGEPLLPRPAGSVDLKPIGESEPPPPPGLEGDSRSISGRESESAPETNKSDVQIPVQPGFAAPGGLREGPRESDSGPYLTDREKEELIRKIDEANRSAASKQEAVTNRIDSTSSTTENQSGLPQPRMAGRGKGIAYFYKNFIQVVSSQAIHPDDELLLNDRCYELKPKRIGSGAIIGGSVVLFAIILVIVGSLFVSDMDRGTGEILGMALDDGGQPYVQGSRIKLPDLGISVRSNPQGFFRFDEVAPGTHRIEYHFPGRPATAEYTTVAAGEVSMITLKPSVDEAEAFGSVSGVRGQSGGASISGSVPDGSLPPDVSRQKPVGASKKKTTKTGFSKLILAASVDGARLSIDGKVLGAGNLTYSGLKSGRHTYAVEADGYQPAAGTIDLKAGKTERLKVALVPMTQEQLEAAYSAEDFYYAGTSHLKSGDHAAAVDYLTRAISIQPSYADAYRARADAYTRGSAPTLAHDDYIRAAEIFRMNKDFNPAITAYNSAIEVDGKSLAAYLGRAELYLHKGEEIAALADYEAALKIDKKCGAAHFGLGEARFKQGNYKKAIQHFKKARSLDEKDPLVHQYLMLSYLLVDDTRNVKKCYKTFQKVASESEIDRFRTDERFSAVLKIVETE